MIAFYIVAPALHCIDIGNRLSDGVCLVAARFFGSPFFIWQSVFYLAACFFGSLFHLEAHFLFFAARFLFLAARFSFLAACFSYFGSPSFFFWQQFFFFWHHKYLSVYTHPSVSHVPRQGNSQNTFGILFLPLRNEKTYLRTRRADLHGATILKHQCKAK